MDTPLSILKEIFGLALKIKEAVDTVRQNKEVCLEIRTRVNTLRAILSCLTKSELLMHPAMSEALQVLQGTLSRALDLVMACQEEKNVISKIFSATSLSKQLHQVNKDIIQDMAIANFGNTVHNTIMLSKRAQDEAPLKEEIDSSVKKEQIDSAVESAAASMSSGFEWYILSELEKATDNFSEENVIWKCGSVTVYQGKLPGECQVAIKVYSDEQFSTCREQRNNDVRFAAELMHKNIVKLLGCCYTGTGGLFLQVYVYAHYRSLSDYMGGRMRALVPRPTQSGLNVSPETQKLCWPRCFKIIQGIAQGVLYLHDHCGLRIIHLNLKPSTILLDQGFNPRIDDFSISQMLPESMDKGVVACITATWGFAAPEYVHYLRFSAKSDVHSYGVLLLELVTGVSCDQANESYNPLTASVWKHWKRERLDECIDPWLRDVSESQIDEMRRCIHIALLCVEEDPALRPTMDRVVWMLGDNRLNLPKPEKPSYITPPLGILKQKYKNKLHHI